MSEQAEPRVESSEERTWTRREIVARGAAAAGAVAVASTGAKAARASTALRRTTSEVHFYVVNNVTGSGAYYGEGTKRLEHLLADRVNAAGGFKDAHGNKYTLRLTDFDPGDSREAAVAAMRKAIGDKSALAVISPGSDVAWLSMLPLAGQYKMPLIIPSDGSPVTNWNPYAFRIDTSAEKGFGAFIGHYKKRLQLDDIALINDTAFASVAFEGDLWRKNAKKYGYNLVASETFRTGDTDFSAQLTTIRGKKPRWVMVVAQPPEMIKIINQMAQFGIKAKLYGSYGSNDTSEVWKGTNGLVKDSYFFAPGVPTPKAMRNPLPYNLYNEKYNDIPIIFHIFGWDALNIAMDAVKRSGSATDREKFRNALGNTRNFPLVTSGHVNWKNPPSGDNMTPPVVVGVVTGPGTAKIIETV